MDIQKIEEISRKIRNWCVKMTTIAGSGHLTSSLSAVEAMVVLMFSKKHFFRYELENPERIDNDRLIFSKGHASPLFYSLWAMAGGVNVEDLKTFRTFESVLEGHPTRRFPFTEVPTGSLGQGIGIGVGEALYVKKFFKENQNIPRVFVLLGDSELTEGSVWESAMIASHYKLDNLVAIVDVNRLGQRGETVDGWNLSVIGKKFEAFGWNVVNVEDGHSPEQIENAYELAREKKKPCAILMKTLKGKGISFLENKNNWHGKALNDDEAKRALEEIDDRKEDFFLKLPKPEEYEKREILVDLSEYQQETFTKGLRMAPRRVCGKTLARMGKYDERIVVLDAEVSNSTSSEDFGKIYPERFLEMFIAEQNMVSVATGMARRGAIPFIFTFGAFFSRAFDQIRMAGYSDVSMIFIGSHVGVSIGEDGVSQMALEDMAMFSTIENVHIFSPSDAVSMEKCLYLGKDLKGLTYIRSTRAELPVLYQENEIFSLGGSKTLQESKQDVVTVIVCGITVHEALRAYEILKKENIFIRIVDAYSIRPLDKEMILRNGEETSAIITVEDHRGHGGLADAVKEILCEIEGMSVRFRSLAVRKRPQSGKPEQLLHWEEIDAEAIVKTVKDLL
ncbi:MAG: transketolase [Candidatus Moraniibacteriota bacterium]|nr:MAG: transketolase [Candidatus Moranbacteria bacterium]